LHRLFHQIADSSSGWLSAANPEFEILGTVIVSLPVTVMHFLLRQERTPKDLGHDLCMFCDVSLALGIRMVGVPDIYIARAGGLVPTLPLIQLPQWFALSKLLIVGRAVAAATVPIRATREVATCPSAAQRS
jgi:hypothetical protein